MNTQKTESQDFRKTIIIDPDNVINNPYYEQTKHLSFLLAQFYKEHKRVPDLFEVQDILRIASNRIGYF